MINIYHIMLYFAHISLMHVPNNHFYGYFCGDFVGDFSDFGDFSHSSHRKTMVRETALFGTFTSMKKTSLSLKEIQRRAIHGMLILESVSVLFHRMRLDDIYLLTFG